MLRDLVDKQCKTVVAVTHDLGLAARMDRQAQLMDGGIVSARALAAEPWAHAVVAPVDLKERFS
jgi:ABC-type lipoprotein export system ATPase subunit